MSSKGQYKILYEVMLILIGIFITGYVISNFTNLQGTITDIVVIDNLQSVGNKVTIGILKVSAVPGSVERIDIPEKISDYVYTINLSADSVLNVSTISTPSISVSRQIFNIGQVNKINSSQVSSGARIIEVLNENGYIRIRRGIYG